MPNVKNLANSKAFRDYTPQQRGSQVALSNFCNFQKNKTKCQSRLPHVEISQVRRGTEGV